MTALIALLIAMPVLAVIAQPVSAHERTTQRCDYDPISGMSFNCRQVPVSHTHPKPKPEPTCPTGTTGTPPNCVPIPSDNTNHAGDQGDESDGSDSSDGNGDSDGPFGGSQEENPTQENINSQNNQDHDSGSNQRGESSDDTEPEDGNGGAESGEQGDAEEGGSDGAQLSNPPVHTADPDDKNEGGSDPESDQGTGSDPRPGPCQTQPPRPGCAQNPDTGNTPQRPAQDDHQDPDLEELEDAASTAVCQLMSSVDNKAGFVCGTTTLITDHSMDAVEDGTVDKTELVKDALELGFCTYAAKVSKGIGVVCAGVTYVVPAVQSVADAIAQVFANSDVEPTPPPTGTTTPSDSEPDDADENNGDEGSQDGSGESTPPSESPPTGTTTPPSAEAPAEAKKDPPCDPRCRLRRRLIELGHEHGWVSI